MRFSKDHEWVNLEGDMATVGITAYAADQLGDIVFVELPAAGKSVKSGDGLAGVESVKAAADVFSPGSGEVTPVHDKPPANPPTAETAPAAGGTGPFFGGAGAYRHHVPASVDHLIQRSEFLTSYTPYQPEIAQGTLQTLFEFQTQVAALTGLPVANASMYDGSTACAEAVLMAARVTRRRKAVLSGGLHPHYAETTRTLAHSAGIETQRLAAAVDAEDAVLAAV